MQESKQNFGGDQSKLFCIKHLSKYCIFIHTIEKVALKGTMRMEEGQEDGEC